MSTLTAAQRVAEIEQIPRSCVCTWTWRTGEWAWQLTGFNPNCPWHLGAAVAAAAAERAVRRDG